MFTSVEFFVARRYLFSSRREGFVSVIAWFSFLGIALGVATLIVVMSVMNGFREELLTRLVGMRGHIIVQKRETQFDQHEALIKLIKNVPGVLSVSPLMERQGVLMTPHMAQGVMIRGILLEDLKKRDQVMQKLNHTDFSEKGIWVGRRLAERLNLRMGDYATLLIPEVHNTALGALPKQKRLQIEGIFEVGMNEYDKSVIFMPLSSAQKLFHLPDSVSYLEIFSTSMETVSSLALTLEKALGDDYAVLDWQHTDAHIFQAVKIERNVMFLILTLMILIASFNIVSGLIILVKDKVKDIAILRTMGMSQGMILRIFLYVGSSIGVGGAILGTFIGLMFAMHIEEIRQFLQNFLGTELFDAEVYFLTQLPCRLNFHDVRRIVLLSCGISFLATLYPAWRAAKQDPAIGVRG